MSNPFKRRRLRLGLLCSLLAATIAAGCWVRSQIGWLEARRAIIENPHIEIGLYAASYAQPVDSDTPQLLEITCQPAPWPLGWLGEQGCVAVFFEQAVSQDEVTRVRGLFPEADVECIAEAFAKATQ